MATNSIIHRLQNEHLPELLTLHQDCRWLISKLNIAEKEDLQSNELRLLQFSSIVDNMITQIKSYQSNYKFSGDDEKRLLELEGKISNSVLPLKTRLLERMQVRTEFKPPAAYQTQVPVQVQQAPPVQVNQTLTQPQSNHQYQLQLQPHKQRFPAATQPYVSYQPQYNGITKDNIGHSSYPAIIQLADVENSAKILINESNASSSDYTSESTSSDKDSNVDNPQGKVDKDFCPQIIPPSSLQSHQRVATHSGPPPPASVTVARPKGGVVKAAPAINSATTTACNGMAKALGQSNLSAHGTSKTSGPQESGMASSLHSTVPTKPNHLPPSTTTAAVNKSVPTGMVRQTNKASDSSTTNSTVNGTSKAALPLSTSSKNVSGVAPPVQVSAVTKCSPLTAKLYGNYANLFAATAAPSTATSTSISTVSKDPSSTQSQTKKSVGIAVKQPPLAAAAVAVAVIKPPPATESIPPIHPNNPSNSLKQSSTSISNSSIINANANVTKSSASVPPDRDEDTYNKLFQLWASAADDPMSKQQQSGGPRQPERVSSGDGQATNSRSRANSVDLFFSDDDDYSTFDSLEYDKISEDVLRNNAMKNTLQGSQTSIIGQYGIAEAPVVQNTSFCKPPPVNVYSSISNSAVISSSSFANCHNGGLAANYSNEITHEDVINGLQKPGCLPKRPSFNKNVFDDGCGDNLEVNCFGEAVLISDIPIMEASMPIHPYNAVSMENYNSFKPSGLANLSNFVMYPGARTSSFPGSSVNTTSSPSNKRQIAEISNAGATMYGNKAPNSLNRGVDAKKSVSSSASSAASSSRNTATTSATANTASTANNGTAASGGGNHNAYRNGGVESTSSTISSTTSSISLDPLRRQQVCIKSEIMSLLQPTKESNATAPTGSATPKGDHPMTLQASASNAKRSPTTTSDESEVQFYKSSVDIDTSNAMALGGFDNGSAKETNGDEFMSSRRRKRLHQIVPNPRKPRQADYTCFVCSEAYRCNVSDNPWWAVYMHECPRCKQVQIPRLDITIPSNAIELDPNTMALYGEGLEDGGEDADADDFASDDEESYDENSKEEVQPLGQGAEAGGSDLTTPNDSSSGGGGAGDGADNKDGEEEKPFEGEGAMQKEEASKLLVLMCHARVCSGSHSSAKHADICKSTKFLMLHIRDCRGVDLHGRECLFPWCGPCKKMLKHLAQCFTPETCHVCNPWVLPESYQQLRRLNQMKLCQVTGVSSTSS